MSETAQKTAPVPASREGMLKISEIFHSLQGEARAAGWPTVFIRLTGCPLRCVYCDSEYAFFGGEWMHFDDILAATAQHAVRHVCVTGGEPLAQRRCLQLLERLCDAGYEVSLETSGAMDVSAVDARVSRVVDVKTPASGEVARNRWQNLEVLTAKDQLKFVLASEEDYQWAREQIHTRQLDQICEVLFSPVWEGVNPTDLAEWVLADRLPVRVQIQLHKVLWGDLPGK